MPLENCCQSMYSWFRQHRATLTDGLTWCRAVFLFILVTWEQCCFPRASPCAEATTRQMYEDRARHLPPPLPGLLFMLHFTERSLSANIVRAVISRCVIMPGGVPTPRFLVLFCRCAKAFMEDITGQHTFPPSE